MRIVVSKAYSYFLILVLIMHSSITDTPFNPFVPELPVTALTDPRRFYRLSHHQL